MTIRRNQEFTSKDDHHQPFFEEDGFQAHGVHSRTRTQNGFKIFSRDGWHYDSEQIELLQQNLRVLQKPRCLPDQRTVNVEYLTTNNHNQPVLP